MSDVLTDLRKMAALWRRTAKECKAKGEALHYAKASDRLIAAANEIDRQRAWIKRWRAYPVVSITCGQDFTGDVRGHEIPREEIEAAINGEGKAKPNPRGAP